MGKKPLISHLRFCTFVWVSLCLLMLLVLLVLLVRAKSFRKKKNKEFKTDEFKTLITSFILLLNLSYYKHVFFNHYDLFQSLQSFAIISGGFSVSQVSRDD